MDKKDGKAEAELAALDEIATPMTATEAQTRGEIDMQIATARRFPRDIKRFMQRAESYATMNDDIAASCFYKLKRKSRDGGEAFIEGPTVRFAEIIASTYGHMRIDARTVNEDDRFVYSQGLAWDLQENVAIRFEVRRRITDRNGRKFSDDMVGVTANAASAIALRNAVFRVVPKAYWELIYERAKVVATGNQQTLVERRKKMVDYFVQKLRIPAEKIYAHLEVDGIESMTLEHVETLRGIATAIKEGDTTIDKEFFGRGDDDGKLAMPKAKEPPKVIEQEKSQEKPVSSGDQSSALPGIEEKPKAESAEPTLREKMLADIAAATADSWAGVKQILLGQLRGLSGAEQKLEITKAMNARQSQLFPSV